MSDIPAKDLPKFVVRLPEDAKRWLKDEADRNASSQNSEVVRAIRERMDRAALESLAVGRL